MSDEANARRSDRVGMWIAQRPATAVLLAAGFAFLIAAAVAIPLVASKASQVSDLESELAASSAEIENVEAERDKAEAVADSIRGERDLIISDAKAQADEIVGAANRKLADLNDQIDQAEGDLTSTQGRLDAVNSSLQQAQATKQMSTFGDGTWSVGEDVLAGTYRSTAGGSCYWEILNSPSGGGINNIIDNGFGPNATITVSTGQWLRVNRCGTWNPGP